MKPENIVNEPPADYGNILSLEQLDLSKRYSYADYFRWKFQERVELIKGFIYKMSPAPSAKHQLAVTNLTFYFAGYFRQKPCKVFVAPFDVRLSDSKKQKVQDELVFTVVQPDLSVICDTGKIDERGCVGAPDLVIEILSPGNTKKEMGIKFDLYEENGVKEYWLVELSEKVVYVYILKDGKFIGLKPFTEDDEMRSSLFKDLRFPVEDIFK
jgi:Uma2 family endonuclease